VVEGPPKLYQTFTAFLPQPNNFASLHTHSVVGKENNFPKRRKINYAK
jgi:hypothetical protein